MAKQAQQDDLVIEITGSIASADAATKAKLAQTVKANTALDVVLKSTTEGVGRVVGYTNASGTITVVYVKSSTGTLETLTVEQPSA